jgi:hypothetical protein
VAIDGNQVATSRLGDNGGSRRTIQSRVPEAREDEEEGEIENFFGQLWWVPPPSSPRVCSSTNLVWIYHDLWISRSFRVSDCFSVQPGDTLKPELKVCNFTDGIWGRGEHDSFLQVLKEGTAGRAGRSRGQNNMDEFWNDQSWWNHEFRAVSLVASA